MRKSSIRKLPSSVGSQVLEAVQDTYMSLFLEIFSRHLTLPPKKNNTPTKTFFSLPNQMELSFLLVLFWVGENTSCNFHKDNS